MEGKEDASIRPGKGAGRRGIDKCNFMIQCLYITPCRDGKTPRSGPLGIHGPSQFTKSDVRPSTLMRYQEPVDDGAAWSRENFLTSVEALLYCYPAIDTDIRCGLKCLIIFPKFFHDDQRLQ